MKNKTLTELAAEHQELSEKTQQAFRNFMNDKTADNYSLYRKAKKERDELLKSIMIY